MDDPVVMDEENSSNRGRVGPLGGDDILGVDADRADLAEKRQANDGRQRGGGNEGDGVGGGVGSSADAGMGGGGVGSSGGSGADAGMGGAPTG